MSEELEQLNQKIKAIKAKKDAAAAEHARLVKQKASKEKKEAAHKEWERLWGELKSLYAKKKELAVGRGKKFKKEDKSFLEAKPVRVLGKVGMGITKPDRVLMSDGSIAIMKKSSSSIRVSNFAEGMNMKVSDLDNEVIAYKLDRLLGLNVVPPTKLEEFEGEVRSFQKWIKDSKTLRQSEFNKGILLDPSEIFEGEKISKEDMFKTLLLDYLGNMKDRHASNVLFSPGSKKVYAIDNGYAYPTIKQSPEQAGRIFRGLATNYKGVIPVDKKIVKQVYEKLAGMSKEDITKAISVPIKHTYGYNDKDMEVVVENLIKRNKGLLKILEGS